MNAETGFGVNVIAPGVGVGVGEGVGVTGGVGVETVTGTLTLFAPKPVTLIVHVPFALAVIAKLPLGPDAPAGAIDANEAHPAPGTKLPV